MEEVPKYSIAVDSATLEANSTALAQTDVEYYVAEHPGGLRLFTNTQEDLEKISAVLKQVSSNTTFEQLLRKPSADKKMERVNQQNLSKLEALRRKHEEG